VIKKYCVGTFDKQAVYETEISWHPEVDVCESVAELCAEDYHCNHDGFESSWPVKIILVSRDDKPQATFAVDRFTEPSFSASRVKQVPQ